MEEVAYTEASVAGRPPVWFAVQPGAGDAVAEWLLQNDYIHEPVQRLFLDLVEPGARVVDLGSHLGVFSLPAAAAGAAVTAVDADHVHRELLRLAAERNGFADLETVQGAIGRGSSVDFVERSIHGHVWAEGDPIAPTHTVRVVTVDALVSARGWDTVDVVKMDVEGGELFALDGMRGLLASGCRPTIVFECNASMLPRYGASTHELRREMERIGYRLYLVDHLRPGVLHEASANTLQPECVTDYLAVTTLPDRIRERWQIEPAFGPQDGAVRLIAQGVGKTVGYRLYAAQVLAAHPELAERVPLAGPLRAALALDEEAVVVAAATGPDAREPPVEWGVDLEPEAAVWLESVAAQERTEGLPRLAPAADGSHTLLTDVSLLVRRGEHVAVLTDEPDAGRLLLRTILGAADVREGAVRLDATPVLITPFTDLTEPALTCRENVAVLAAAACGSVGRALAGAPDLATALGFADRIDAPLTSLTAAETARLVLGATATFAGADVVLLLEALPILRDIAYRDRLQRALLELKARGGSILEVATDATLLSLPPDMTMWLAHGNTAALGHADSLNERFQRTRYGLADAELTEAPA